jgi:hypothetical protein
VVTGSCSSEENLVFSQVDPAKVKIFLGAVTGCDFAGCPPRNETNFEILSISTEI